MTDIIPANAFEQDVVTFRAMLDASQQTHGCVGANRVVKLHRVQILYRDPPENRSIRARKKENVIDFPFRLLYSMPPILLFCLF